mmetsp:Transcript_20205/g.47133  ORF Transcript_20205/g.47133 Transcript_20205/m.47133 type:complete len:218 (+) Transcript_20205:1016-1669(+)
MHTLRWRLLHCVVTWALPQNLGILLQCTTDPSVRPDPVGHTSSGRCNLICASMQNCWEFQWTTTPPLIACHCSGLTSDGHSNASPPCTKSCQTNGAVHFVANFHDQPGAATRFCLIMVMCMNRCCHQSLLQLPSRKTHAPLLAMGRQVAGSCPCQLRFGVTLWARVSSSNLARHQQPSFWHSWAASSGSDACVRRPMTMALHGRWRGACCQCGMGVC